MQHLYAGVTWRRDVTSKTAYLTFDDGPIPEVTPRVLDILARYQVHATFFCVGENIVKHPDVFLRVIDEGHAVGNHTFNHLPGWQTPTTTYLSNIAMADEVMRANGVTTHLFRPPYGRMRTAQKRTVGREYEIIMWDVLTHDYNTNYYTPQMILNIVRRYTRNGSIINFHDSIKSEKNVLGALPQTIEWLLNEGYQLDTL